MEDRWEAPSPSLTDGHADAAVALAYAPWWRRLLSAVLDQFALSALMWPFVQGHLKGFLSTSSGGSPSMADFRYLAVATLLSLVVYSTAMHAWRGATIGKMALRIVVVRDDGSKVTPAVAFVRAVALAGIYLVSTLLVFAPIVVDFLRPIWQKKRQTWHDQIAGTVVVLAGSGDPS